jgi:ubiquinone/menaquinone biosynthesis C-methylase UbiE
LAEYPAVDFQALPYPDKRFDLVIHSDTLEHIPDPVLALRESLRVLKPGGWMCYTVPALLGRLTVSTAGRPPTYHGTKADEVRQDESERVHTEFGADFWTMPIEAGFTEVRLYPFDFPAAVAIAARR